MKVLAIGAHFDDLELGCGGALARHCLKEDRVVGFVATVSGFIDANGKIVRDDASAKREAMEASKIIGYDLLTGDFPTFNIEFNDVLNTRMTKLIGEQEPDLIYTHWTNDVHHDHRNLALSTLHAARHIPRILMYRSNFYGGNETFIENFFVDITATWDNKEKALKAYETEMRRTNYEWVDWLRMDAINQGRKIGKRYAEAFQAVRWMED